MGIIEAAKLAFEYKKYDENGEVEETIRAVDGVNLDVKKGDFVAILGHNGSGKSTLAKQINAILTPTDGTLYVDGMDVRDEKNIWDVRKTAGMVFQNPDNQIIGTVVEEDVGFGPENMGIPTEEIWERVEESLESCRHVGISQKFSKQTFRRTKTACGDRRRGCNASKMHRVWMSRPQCWIRTAEKK